ncbi:hypothetical protein RI129_007844 [Pyrocoelia pectoralis]|uniref:Peptidase S1 domain-containing protein n=1 Tax=Pyrocoelia pectoralis TaxID=417401 RepID=A0AAN7VIE1_9COLE
MTSLISLHFYKFLLWSLCVDYSICNRTPNHNAHSAVNVPLDLKLKIRRSPRLVLTSYDRGTSLRQHDAIQYSNQFFYCTWYSFLSATAMFEKMLFVIVTVDIVLASSDSNLLAPRTYCGLQHSDDYVRDNHGILLDEFPWIAQLLTGVRFGDYDVTTDKDCTNHTRFGEECSDPVEEFGIEELIPHPQYNIRTAANDIGLIRLSRDVEYSEYIRAICLPTTNNFDLDDGAKLTVSGWGVTSFLGESAKIKKKVSAKIFPIDQCLRQYNDSRRIVSLNHFCVVEALAVCQGDSGGPLMLSVKNQWEQVGILSFGKACGNFSSVYIKVTSYLDWIKANLRL